MVNGDRLIAGDQQRAEYHFAAQLCATVFITGMGGKRRWLWFITRIAGKFDCVTDGERSPYLVAFSSLFDTDAVVGGAGGICFVGYDPGGIRSVKLKRRIMSPPLLYVLKINSDEPASRNDF